MPSSSSRKRRSSAPRVQFLWWAECPSWERALAGLKEAMEEAGLDPASVEVTEVIDQDDAQRLSFVGSPTIRVDGVDVDPPAEGDSQQPGLTCRIYRREDGRVSPLPDGEQIREALRKATQAKGGG